MNPTQAFSSSRRRLLRLSAGGVLLIPVVNLLGCADESASPTPSPQTEPDAATPSNAQPTQAPAAPAAAVPETRAPSAPPPQLTRLQESDSSAAALGYRHAAADVDPAKFPRYQEGQICANCNLYVAENSPEPGWGACSIFPGKLVNADGWCNVYQPMA